MNMPERPLCMPEKIIVVIPCFRCRDQILDVLDDIPDTVHHIICVDDACPEETGKHILENTDDPRVEVRFNPENLGVGGATMAGYRRGLELAADIVVKIDGDGQMDAALLDRFIAPISAGEADYAKGNRFYDLSALDAMPATRILGNAALSFLAKLSSGYWNIMDPTNGYTAISAPMLKLLPLDRIDQRYFFESDMLFRLSTFRAVVLDVPIPSIYRDESSNLVIHREATGFFCRHIGRTGKRIFYNYFLRNFNIASLNLVLGSVLLLSGLCMGIVEHLQNAALNLPTPTGVLVIVLLQLFVGFELLLSFVNFDVTHVPSRPVTRTLARHTVTSPG